MEPTYGYEIDVMAFQLLARLDRYEQAMERLADSRWNAENHRAATACFEEMKSFAASIPRLSVPWVELLISRFELTAHKSFLDHQRCGDDTKLRDLKERHSAAVQALRDRAGAYIRRT